jgi:hypothetical protein
MSIGAIAIVGNVLYLSPEALEEHGFIRDIRGPHPFVVLRVETNSEFTYCLMVPLTTKGSRNDAIPISRELRRGTDKFCKAECYVYSKRYAHWYAAWAVQEALNRGPNASHGGDVLTQEGTTYVLGSVFEPPLQPHCASAPGVWWTKGVQ